jgi:hypothetical protein
MGKPGKALRRLGIAATVLLPLLTGCASSGQRDDPLYGGQGSDADYGEYGPPPYRRPPVAAASSSGSSSTATLAANTRPALDQQNYLGIDRRGKNAKGNPNPFTWEQAQDQLRARGVNYQELENRDGQWHFVCSVPNRQNPNLSRFYEATAGDDLSAVKAVLDRIDTQR